MLEDAKAAKEEDALISRMRADAAACDAEMRQLAAKEDYRGAERVKLKKEGLLKRLGRKLKARETKASTASTVIPGTLDAKRAEA